MSSAFEIKELDFCDIALAKQLFLFFQIDDGVENPTAASDEYLKNLLSRDDFHVIVALENGKIIGGLTAYELVKYKREVKEMFLYEIGVEPAYRRKGIAAELIEFLKRICGEKGIKEMFVGALASNSPAINLYKATGGIGEEVIEFDYELD